VIARGILNGLCLVPLALLLFTGSAAEAGRSSRYITDLHPEYVNPKIWASWRASMSKKAWQDYRDSLTPEGVQFLRASLSPQNFKAWHEKMTERDLELWHEFEPNPITFAFKGRAFDTY
jgi:hypothetical protein